MARITKPLTAREVESAQPRDKDYVLFDGEGLQLRVRASGSKLWNFNYRHPSTKKRINMGLGPYPTLKLATARQLAKEAKELVAQGIDPKTQRQQIQATEKAQTEHTLLNIAKQWFEVKRASVSEDYATDVWRSLEANIFPQLGNTPISNINAPDVIQLMRPVEAKGSLETVKRVNQRLNEIMTYAVNCGYIHANPLTGLKAIFKKPKKQHMKALKPDELPELMHAIAEASIKKVTRYLIKWQLHTMTRPNEAAGARWDEIDFDRKVWVIPAERMKKKREHAIPLSKESLNLLTAIKPISGHREFIFPADRNPRTHTNNSTANMALKRMGFAGRLVSHGMRSLASTTLNEQGFSPDLIEAALAHVDKNQVRAAYNRTDYLEQRREMMSWWSGHIEEAAKGSLSVTGTK